VDEGSLREYELDPEELGVPRCEVDELRGGEAAHNARALRAVLGGADGGHRSAVVLNAAGAIAASGHARDLAEGIGLAVEAIDSGAAGERLEELIAFSRESEVPA
jgi:anthranilate phosphoribosyltransferase